MSTERVPAAQPNLYFKFLHDWIIRIMWKSKMSLASICCSWRRDVSSQNRRASQSCKELNCRFRVSDADSPRKIPTLQMWKCLDCLVSRRHAQSFYCFTGSAPTRAPFVMSVICHYKVGVHWFCLETGTKGLSCQDRFRAG